ncbi:MAG TPA: branched-chain amino acid ABC transporter permease [Planctomycetota bacterium]|jgi:branched-chain amino acid transport system permease protein
MKNWRRYLGIVSLLLAVVAVQQYASSTQQGFLLTPLTMSAYYALVVLGLCVLMGYAGQVSLGHAAFFAIGGYTSAALTTCNLSAFAKQPFLAVLTRWGVLLEGENIFLEKTLSVHPWAAAVIAILLAVSIACILGGPILRLKGHYLAMATLGFGMIVRTVVLAVECLGGADGIADVPPFPLFAKFSINSDLSAKISNYYVAWIVVAAAMLLLLNLIDSRAGRAMRAIHGAEEAAAAMGVNTSVYKLKALVVSAALAALAGVLMTHYNGGIGPSEAGVMKSIRYVAIVAVGGMANLAGALLAAVVLNYLSLRGTFGTYDDAVFGAVLIGVMIFAPDGLLRLGLFSRLKNVLPFLRPAKTEASA